MYTHIDLSNLLHLIYCIYISLVYLWIFMLLICVVQKSTRTHPAFQPWTKADSETKPGRFKWTNINHEQLCWTKMDMKDIMDIQKINHWSIDLLYLTKISTIYDMIIEGVGMWSHHCGPNSICWYDPVEQVGPLGMSYRNSSWVWSILSYSQRRVR